MRNEKGITMITLVITIMVLVVLASVATYSGITVIQTAKLTAFTTELKIIQTEVNAIYEKESKEKYNNYGKEIQGDILNRAKEVFGESGITNQEGYRYWDNDTIKLLGIEGVEHTFFVNIEKRSVVSYEGLEYDGKTCYTLNQLPEGLYNVEYNGSNITQEPSFEINYEYRGVNKWEISISNIQYDNDYSSYIDKWQVKYKLEEKDDWNTSEDLSFIVKEVGVYQIKLQNGNVQSREKEIEIRNIVKAVDIANNPQENYGKIVTEYRCTNSKAIENWKIFYADESNIYLIADDYIASDYVPKGKNGSSINTNGSYKMYFTNVLKDYVGTSDITNSKVRALDSNYYISRNYSSTNNNMKAVAYMLDTNVWSVFQGDKASYAIAGPTLEIFLKSYNQKYNTNYQARAKSNVGYEISKDGGTSWANYYGGMIDTSDNLYIKSSTQSMWLASPSANNSDSIMLVNYGGVTATGYTGNVLGFRPLVCLKSNVELEKQEDGSYKIMN
ncbi:MAG: hypothetical protein HFJ35_05470 [Clostridia bacterium]|nr:hypothetical protein [Clostridia bacterium]